MFSRVATEVASRGASTRAAAKGEIEVDVDHDKGHGRIETRTVSVMRQVDWLDGDRRFPGEVRFRDARAGGPVASARVRPGRRIERT